MCAIDLKQITSDSASMVSNAINDSAAQGAQAFVLDLRDVPGGYLTQAVDIASLFIQSGVVAQIETVSGTSSRSADGNSITSAPLVVITNGRTAGCAEVLAAALQESGRAEIVGEKTQGKGLHRSVLSNSQRSSDRRQWDFPKCGNLACGNAGNGCIRLCPFANLVKGSYGTTQF